MTRRELRKELTELRGLLEIRERRTIDEWEAMPQELRDPLAARALIAEWGDRGAALIRLGFPSLSRLPPRQVRAYEDHVQRVFETPGVRAIIRRELAQIEAERAALIERQVRVALYGDNDASIRAFEGLARVCGWTQHGSPPTVTDGATRSIAEVLASIRDRHRVVEAGSANLEATTPR